VIAHFKEVGLIIIGVGDKMDTFGSKKRSWIMAQVRSKGNKSTELKLLAVLRENRIAGWRRAYELLGKPDFVFPKEKVAVFVDGCFWHGHPRKCRMPETNRAYWEQKIARNVARDRDVTRILRQRGWKVVRIWEDSVQKTSTLTRLRKALR
jgi:DNA mismatch endonuclease, patch repair protein